MLNDLLDRNVKWSEQKNPAILHVWPHGNRLNSSGSAVLTAGCLPMSSQVSIQARCLCTATWQMLSIRRI